MNYGFVKEMTLPFEEAVAALTAALKKEGFGILTKIDLREKFKEKLGVEFRNYVILGACNPANAYKALQAEENIGLLLPCNAIVYEKAGRTAVAMIRPSASMGSIDNEAVKPVAAEVEAALRRALDSLPGSYTSGN
ncbi:MAG: hypothetical protein CVU79_05360 [Elusimicrobia bacterium HGW-Elusimicrobia-3]|nr:MAG: hypothetical protein CVU79_05360 [Elusimicrobia bacterium HGW-Elusimicrobia-3]